MNFQETYQQLNQIFEQKEINNELLAELKNRRIAEIKTTLKIYLLEFLIDPEDKKATIKTEKDFWFYNENAETTNLINKYIELMINLIKTDKFFSINIFKDMEIFINSNIGNKIIYMFSILNILDLPDNIYLLFLGFILGEKKDFIKKNYISNLKDLLGIIKSNILNINEQMPISLLDENNLEILNLYFFFKMFKPRDKISIDSIENALFSFDSNFNKIIYYYKIEKSKLLENIFFIENNNLKIDIIIKKVNLLIQNIKKDINDFLLKNNNIIIEESSESEEFLNEENEEIEENCEEEKEKLIMISKNESPSFDFDSFDKINNLNKDSKAENESNNPKNENSLNKEKNNLNNESKNNSQRREEKFKDEIKMKIEETKDNIINNKKNDNNNFKNNNIGNNIKKETYSDTSINLNSSKDSFNSKIFDQLKTFENYPSIDKFIINENKNDNEDSDKEFFILEALSYIISLNNMVNAVGNQLRNLFQNITFILDKIKNNIKFKMLSINNTRLEIIINYLKNPNIINIKRKLIEILIFHLYDENSNYFENDDEEYSPTIYNLKALEELIKAKMKSDKNNENIKKDLNKLIKEKEKILKKRTEKDKDITNELENNINNNINNEVVHNKDNNNSNAIIDEDKKRQLNITQSFLDFYFNKLQLFANVSKNNEDLYLLPGNYFNIEVKENEYLFDLESIISENKKDNKGNNDNNNEIVGLEKNKLEDLKILNEKKIINYR